MCEIQHEGQGQEDSTEQGEVESCIGLDTQPRVPYFTYSTLSFTYDITRPLCVI